MQVEKLMQLRLSNEAPYAHDQFAVWLHDIIINDVRNEILDAASKEEPFTFIKALHLPSLQTIQ